VIVVYPHMNALFDLLFMLGELFWQVSCICSEMLNRLQDFTRPLNLLQERNILTVGSTEMPLPNLPHEFKKINCNPESVTILCCCLVIVSGSIGTLVQCRVRIMVPYLYLIINFVCTEASLL